MNANAYCSETAEDIETKLLLYNNNILCLVNMLHRYTQIIKNLTNTDMVYGKIASYNTRKQQIFEYAPLE